MIRILKGDLQGLDFDIQVMQANTELLPGKDLFERGGARLMQDMMKLGPKEPGDAVLTEAGNLPARKLIHTVTPVTEDEEALKACWWNSLSIAYNWYLEGEEKGLTIGFPALGCQKYGFEPEQAASIARSITDKLARQYPEISKLEIFIVTKDNAEYNAFKEAFA